jgi:hypothetical protein
MLLVSGQAGHSNTTPGSFLRKPVAPEALFDAVAGLTTASKH